MQYSLSAIDINTTSFMTNDAVLLDRVAYDSDTTFLETRFQVDSTADDAAAADVFALASLASLPLSLELTVPAAQSVASVSAPLVIASTPEPSAAVLITGVFALAASRRRRRVIA